MLCHNTLRFGAFSFRPCSNKTQLEQCMILILLLGGKMQDRRSVRKEKGLQCALTIAVQVVSFICPASRLGWVAGRRTVASTVLCQEVSQSQGLPLLILLLSYRKDEHRAQSQTWKKPAWDCSPYQLPYLGATLFFIKNKKEKLYPLNSLL